MPAVTVVMPAFNAERFIGEALESIARQTLKDLEVIVVDDGSSDGTLDEVARFASALDLTIVRQENAGPSAARNNGIRRARAKRCALLDADDIMLPELLAEQSALLDSDPGIGLVVTDVSTFDERGTIHQARWNLAARRRGAVLDELLLDNFVTTSAVMAPTERLIEAGLFSVARRVAEDYELWLRMAAKWKVGLIDRPLVRYRYVAGSLSYDKLNSALCALDVIETFWREHPDYRASHAAVRHRSLARHLAVAGAVALREGKRREALAYLLKSLGHDPRVLGTWKSMAKLVLARGGRAAPGGRTNATRAA